MTWYAFSVIVDFFFYIEEKRNQPIPCDSAPILYPGYCGDDQGEWWRWWRDLANWGGSNKHGLCGKGMEENGTLTIPPSIRNMLQENWILLHELNLRPKKITITLWD